MCADFCVDIPMPAGVANSMIGSLNAFALPVPPPAVLPPLLAAPETLFCVASVKDLSES